MKEYNRFYMNVEIDLFPDTIIDTEEGKKVCEKISFFMPIKGNLSKRIERELNLYNLTWLNLRGSNAKGI